MTTIAASSNNGVNLDSGFYSNPIVINQGVHLTGDFGGYAIYAASGIWTITNAGQISDSTNGAGIFLGDGGTVTNQSNGVIASFVSTATGIYFQNGAGTVTNLGTINAGVWLQDGGAVTNALGARIVSDSTSGGYGVGLHVGGTVINAGLMSGLLVGIDASADGGSLTNQSGGTLTGTYAGVLLGFPGQTAGGGGTLVNQAGGTIIGDSGVFGGGTSATVNNTGVITGTLAGTISHDGITLVLGAGVSLTAGGMVANHTGGTIAGASYGVQISTATGTVVNYGGIAGGSGSGVELTAGGLVSNASTGTISSTQRDGIYITGAAGTVINAGHVSSSGAEAVQFADGGSISNATASTIIGLAHAGVRVKRATATVLNAGLIEGGGVNSAVQFYAGGSITNQSGGTITGIAIAGGAGTVVNVGTLFGQGVTLGAAVNLAAGGSVTNQVGATISTYLGIFGYNAAVTVLNAGHITGDATAALGGGVILFGGGSVTNQSGATISGHDGIYGDGGSFFNSSNGTTHFSNGAIDSVTNAGIIQASSVDGTGVLLGTGGSVTNQSGGTISGYRGIVGGTIAAATVVNAGTIDGIGTAVSFAAGFANRLVVDPGAVFNGTVTGGNTLGAAAVSTLELASGGSSGVLSNLGSTVVNFGSIAFDPGANWFIAGNTSGLAGTISGFAQGDTIEVTGITVTGSSYANGVLTLTEASGAATLHLPGTFTPSEFVVTNVAGGAQVTTTVTGASGGTTISASSTLGLVLTSPPDTNPVVIDPGVTISSTTGDAISGFSGPWTIQNGGTIAGNPTSSRGIFLSGGGSVTNQSSAAISGGIGIEGFNGALTVVNAGRITGNTTSGVNSGIGIDLVGGGSVTNQSGALISSAIGIYGWTTGVTVVNAGSIAGNGNAGIKLASGGIVTNQGSATINGYTGIFAFDAAATIVNSGTLAGNPTSVGGKGVDLLAGGSVTNQVGGTISGYMGIYGGPGGVVSVVNSGSIAGLGTSPTGAGFAIDLLDGGWVSNASTGTISGVARAGVLITGASAGTVLNAGLIMTSNTRSAMAIEHGGYISNASTGRISSAGGNAIYMSGGFGIVLNAGSITNSGTHIVIDLSSSGFVSNASTGVISSGGGGGAIYTTGGASTVVNAGTLGGVSGIDDTGILTVVNSGTISVGGGGAININAGSGVVTNSGKIISSTGRGVYIGAGGTVTNLANGTISAGAGTGVRIAAGTGTVINAGLIVSGSAPGFYMTGATGTVVNSGHMTSQSDTVVLMAGGAVTNQSTSTIIGKSGAVVVNGATGSVVNAGDLASTLGASVDFNAGGTVINQATGTISSFDVVGVYIKGGAGTVTNAGTISGFLYAVQFGANFTNRLIVDPGAVFNARATGGNALNAGVASTLELATGASTGSLIGLGSQYIDFAQSVIDAGAAWSMTGNGNTIAAGATLTNLGTLSNSGTLLNNGFVIAAAPVDTNLGTIIGSGTIEIAGGSEVAFNAGAANGQSVVFEPGSPETLIVNTPGTALANSVSGLNTGDRIEFSNGMTVTSASVVNTNTVVVNFHGSGGLSGTYDLTNVGFASGSGEQFSVGVDNATGDSYVQVSTVAASTVYDAAADFEQGWTNQDNPNGVWSYGYSTGFPDAVTLYDQTAQPNINGPNAQFWLSSSVNYGESPSAEFNNGPAYDDGNVDFLADQFVLVAGIGGQYSNLVFTAPADGFYSVASSFRGDQNSIDAVVGIAVNGNVVFNSYINAEGQILPFNTNVSLTAGETVDFSVGPNGGLQNTGVSAIITDLGANAPVVSWLTDTPGNFDDPARWTGDTIPAAAVNASIDFADDPQVLHSAGNDTVRSLTNAAGDFVMAGGTLTTPDLDNASLMQWSGGSIVLNGTAATASLTNAGTLTIAPHGQRLMTIGTAAFANSGTLLVAGGSGVANIDAPLVNTGDVIVTQGTLSLNDGGSSNGAGLQGGAGGTLQFGLPAGGGAGNTFIVTGGEYAIGNTTIDNGTLDLSAASSVFFVNSLRIAGAGSLVLGANNAAAQNGFAQGPTSWAGATGIPFLSGSGALTVFGGGSLINGVETGAGVTRLFGTNLLGGTIQLDGGRTVENDGWMNWSSGDIALGAGDPTAATHNGTLANVLGATFYVTADGTIGNQGAGTSALNNAGVIAVFAGSGETDIDATVNNTGYIQAQTGTLSLNGGGMSDGAHLFAANNAVVQFGTLGSGAAGGTFSIASGQYTAADTAITGGTLDVSAASSAVFANRLKITAGALQLGAQSNAVVQGELLQTGGLLKGSASFAVFDGASLTGGVQSGPATTVLFGTSVLGGLFQLDGGRTVENEGWMNWSSGNIALGSGDPTAATHTGTLANASGATFYVTADGRIGTSGAGSGTLNNAGVLAVFAGVGETDIDAFVDSTGYIQAQSGTLSLNGGGTSNGGGLFVASNAVVQFGTAASTGAGGTFSFTGGPYIAGNTVVNGSTLDLSAVSGVSFGNSLTLGSGSLLLGGNFPATADFSQSGGVLSGGGYFYVTAAAALSGGLETGTGRTVLQGGGSISGSVAFDGGHSVENAGVLTWSGGSITLGGGDPDASTHVATLINDTGAVLEIETSGTINSAGFAGTGAISNAGTIVSGGLGTTSVYANLFNNGVVEVTAGTLALEQGVGGTGTFLLDGAATLDFVNGAGSSNTMQFLQPGGTLETQALGTFAPTVSGFASGDVLDAASVGFVMGTTTVGFSGGTVTVADGAQSTAFMLAGSYATNGFQIIGSDGHGGTEVGYV